MSFSFRLPDIGEGVVEGEVVAWKVSEGDLIALDEPMVEIQTDKASVEIPSPRQGTIAKIMFQEGEICPVGDVLVVIDVEGEETSQETQSQESTPQQKTPASPKTSKSSNSKSHGKSSVLAPPSVRKLAREKGVDLESIAIKGKRISAEDVLEAARATTGTSNSESQREERIPLKGVRAKIAENMSQSVSTAAHFTYVEELDVTTLVELRQQAKKNMENLTYLPFFIKAVVAGLKKHPELNATLDEQSKEIVHKFYYHIGIAIQGTNGLVVVVIRDADKKSIKELSHEIVRLSDEVQTNKIKRDDMVGSTFTISSLGQRGGVLATPIINFPEVGILGVHQLKEKPAVYQGEIVPRWLMNLSLSLDHRIVDGWNGAEFMNTVKTALEAPDPMFTDLM